MFELLTPRKSLVGIEPAEGADEIHPQVFDVYRLDTEEPQRFSTIPAANVLGMIMRGDWKLLPGPEVELISTIRNVVLDGGLRPDIAMMALRRTIALFDGEEPTAHEESVVAMAGTEALDHEDLAPDREREAITRMVNFLNYRIASSEDWSTIFEILSDAGYEIADPNDKEFENDTDTGDDYEEVQTP